MNLLDEAPVKNKDELKVPLIQFVDMNNDGMMDQVFYHNKKLHIFYNKNQRGKYEPSVFKSNNNLCELLEEKAEIIFDSIGDNKKSNFISI